MAIQDAMRQAFFGGVFIGIKAAPIKAIVLLRFLTKANIGGGAAEPF
jgi:hypothetical protein